MPRLYVGAADGNHECNNSLLHCFFFLSVFIDKCKPFLEKHTNTCCVGELFTLPGLYIYFNRYPSVQHVVDKVHVNIKVELIEDQQEQHRLYLTLDKVCFMLQFMGL